MAKNFPNLAVGYGTRTGATSAPSLPANPVSSGTKLVKDIRATKGWGK